MLDSTMINRLYKREEVDGTWKLPEYPPEVQGRWIQPSAFQRWYKQ